MPEILLIGDSRVSDYEWFSNTYPEWTVNVIAKKGYKTEDLIEKASQNINPNTAIVVMCAMHCDITYRDLHEDGEYGLMHTHSIPPTEELALVMATWDYQLRMEKDVSLFWLMPVVPDVETYNRKRARYFGIEELCPLLIEQAKQSEKLFKYAIESLTAELQYEGVQIIELQELESNIENAGRTDGLHWNADTKQDLFKGALYEAIQRHPVQKPKKVPNRKSASTRIRIRKHRHEQRYRKVVRNLVMSQLAAGDSCVVGEVKEPTVKSLVRPLEANNKRAPASAGDRRLSARLSEAGHARNQQQGLGEPRQQHRVSARPLEVSHPGPSREEATSGRYKARRGDAGKIQKPDRRPSAKCRLSFPSKR